MPLEIYRHNTLPYPILFFEQALIDFNINSDGVVNGQVLTADIDGVIELDFSYRNISDLTGIENFSALKILNCEQNNLIEIDVSSNLLLEELFCGNTHDDVVGNVFEFIDLSQNPNLTTFWVQGAMSWSAPKMISLKNGNNAILTDVNLLCYADSPISCPSICVEVDDANGANNNNLPYFNWWYKNVIFSEDCALSVQSFESEEIYIYPNPAHDIVHIEIPAYLEIVKTQLFDITGRLIQQSESSELRLDVSDISSGQYILKIYANTGAMTTKLMVN